MAPLAEKMVASFPIAVSSAYSHEAGINVAVGKDVAAVREWPKRPSDAVAGSTEARQEQSKRKRDAGPVKSTGNNSLKASVEDESNGPGSLGTPETLRQGPAPHAYSHLSEPFPFEVDLEYLRSLAEDGEPGESFRSGYPMCTPLRLRPSVYDCKPPKSNSRRR
ncbi:hypothetical protein AcV5_005138 [Taiwanofungus camphoratus]|nr:hypothetical protein AcV5_005138 [Antrodia cinnamomea]